MTEQKLVTITNSWQPTMDMEHIVSVFLGSEDDRYLHKKSEVSLGHTDELCLENSADSSDNCYLEFVCSLGTGLCEICVQSNISIMEVFENVEGYLFTVKGQSATDDFMTCQLKFERPRSHISIKCLGQLSSIKMNCILLRVETVPIPVGRQGSLNIPKLRSIIADLNPETSERASSILDNIETYQKNHQTPIADMNCLLAAAQRSTSSGSNIAELLSSIGNKDSNVNNNEMYSTLQGICGHVTNLRPGPGGTNLNPLVSPESMDSMVKEQISQAESRILETVDERLQQMENRLASKLDVLLSTLSTVQVSDSKSE